ncbi:amidase family protein [uncultured Shewanella sp.]|uniref:amidase family protein n=1 Tax=uncultured Shewanella sp. TaxID=173975 RepID=UPI0026086812|nr:amidase family protein [uncultured Shewanella sp.]
MKKHHDEYAKSRTSHLDPAIFCDHGPRGLILSETGTLVGKRLAVKDVFQLKGEKNTAGSPEWFRTHDGAKETAFSLFQLLKAGAEFIGFTHLDELAYSMQGSNMHYGAADNPKLPGYFCGGSSMGSAAAVASGAADIALGTDTGGSVRVPASYCGLFGIRTSHSLVPRQGVIGLAPCFDTVGWFAQTASLLGDVGKVLLPPSCLPIKRSMRLVICDEINQLADVNIQQAMAEYLPKLQGHFDSVERVSLSDSLILSQLADVFRILQGRGIAKEHGNWLKRHRPILSDDVAARVAMALSITDEEVAWARRKQQDWSQQMAAWLPSNDTVLLLPTSATTALKKDARLSKEALIGLRQRLLGLTAIAGLWGAPQCHVPAFSIRGSSGEKNIKVNKPSGFSLLMAPNNDAALLALVEDIMA